MTLSGSSTQYKGQVYPDLSNMSLTMLTYYALPIPVRKCGRKKVKLVHLPSVSLCLGSGGFPTALADVLYPLLTTLLVGDS